MDEEKQPDEVQNENQQDNKGKPTKRNKNVQTKSKEPRKGKKGTKRETSETLHYLKKDMAAILQFHVYCANIMRCLL